MWDNTDLKLGIPEKFSSLNIDSILIFVSKNYLLIENNTFRNDIKYDNVTNERDFNRDKILLLTEFPANFDYQVHKPNIYMADHQKNGIQHNRYYV